MQKSYIENYEHIIEVFIGVQVMLVFLNYNTNLLKRHNVVKNYYDPEIVFVNSTNSKPFSKVFSKKHFNL